MVRPSLIALVFSVAILGFHAPAPAQCQLQKLSAFDAEPFGAFMHGYDVAIDGERIVVGAPGAGGATFQTGAAYIYTLDQGEWVHEEKIFSSNGVYLGSFGISVDIAGDVIVVGDITQGQGASIFRNIGGSWVEEANLPPPPDALRFGQHVAIDGDVAVVAEFEVGNDSEVYIYRYDGVAWNLEEEIAAPFPGGGAFGRAIDVQGDRVAIGATGLDTASGSGAVFVYDYNPTGGWEEISQIEPEDPAYGFGGAVRFDGERLIVGSRFGFPAAFIFEHDGDQWVQIERLTASDVGGYFGNAVALSGGFAVVGSYTQDEVGPFSGIAYAYREINGEWVQAGSFIGNDVIEGEEFGWAVDVSGSIAVVGTWRHDGPYTPDGAAYVFELADTDCNANGICDGVDISSGFSEDANGDGIPDECTLFVRADVNADGFFDISDVILGLGFLFGGIDLDCPASADVNDDDALDLSDPVYGLELLFGDSSSLPVPLPFPDCGVDPTAGPLECDSYPGCP